ncbi:MAG: thioredoxin domain-containing protein, partial [Stellaceae bacterium]
LCRAALALYEASGSDELLAQACRWVVILDRHYSDSAGGGYFFSADDTEALIARAKTAADSAVPAGNGILVGVLIRLAILTGDDAYRHRAEAIVEAFSGEISRNFFPLATLLNNAELLAEPVQIVIVGEPGEAAFAALRHAVYSVSLPNRVVFSLPAGQELPADHPAYGKRPIAGGAAAYVCIGPVCSLPLTDPEILVAKLSEQR